MIPSYYADIRAALRHITTAIETAALFLPPDVRQQHWIRQKTSPAPWAAAEAWWTARATDAEDADDTYAIAEVLGHIVSLAEAREQLSTIKVRIEGQQRTPDLSLPKVRRSQ